MSDRLIELMENLGRPRIALVGDFMIDRYVYGNAERLSPEAPVPVLHFQHEEYRLGGAGSVAADLAALGAQVHTVGIVGDDEAGKRVRLELSNCGANTDSLLEVSGRPTVCKMRLIGLAQHRRPQQMLRMDVEDATAIDSDLGQRVIDAVAGVLATSDLLCIEDYHKGLLTIDVCTKIIEMARARQVPVIIDPANISDYSKYFGATALKLNRPETERATGLPVRNPKQFGIAANWLIKKLELEAVVITLDKEGAYLATSDGEGRWLKTRERQVYDVTGAGDMVLAMLAVARAAGAPWTEAVALANIAGGLEVEKFGAIPIRPDEIIQELLTEVHQHLGKQRSVEQLLAELQRHRASGKKIVFTNGCFDLIHLGHVKYFQFAKHKGDLLVVAVNSDESIRRLKGPSRPIVGEHDRIGVLEELESIDYLIRFDDDTPLNLIEKIRPDVLVKGADYAKQQVVGWDVVESWGGRVELAPLIDGRSTSDVIRRIIQSTESARS